MNALQIAKKLERDDIIELLLQDERFEYTH